MPRAPRGKTTKTSEEYREIICHYYFIEGRRIIDIARERHMATSTIHDIVNRYRTEGRVKYKLQRGPKNVKIKDRHSEYLRDMMDNEDEGNIFTLEQLKFRLEQDFPEDFPTEESIDLETIRHYIDKKLEFTLKRTKAVEERQLESSTIEKRKQYARKVLTGAIHYMDNCVFVDEAGFTACMVPGRARAKKGKRAHTITKTKLVTNISVISALSSERIEFLQSKMVAGGTNALMFDEFLKDLFQQLEKRYPGQKKYVVMDNVSFHRSDVIKKRFDNSIPEACYLPPYSLMFNPIESCFNNLKNYVKRSPRTEKRNMHYLIAERRETVTSSKCEGWISHCIDNLRRCLEGENVTFEN
jgi:transposase